MVVGQISIYKEKRIKRLRRSMNGFLDDMVFY